MPTSSDEFQEIGHCGGQFTVNIKTAADGSWKIKFGVHHSRPTAAAFFAIYALPQGIPVSTFEIGGIGQQMVPPPVPGCYPIFIASDINGMFGHQCKSCQGYWRSDGAPSQWPMTCPYCGLRDESHNFLTDGQIRYIKACCELVEKVITSDDDGESVIDMDQVADAVGKDCEKPNFYYAEQSQQNKYTCQACGKLNDILGRYGYCSNCGTHNGLNELNVEINRIQEKIAQGRQYETCTKDAVSAFDSFARQIAKQLSKRVPMTPTRKNTWERKKFHQLKPCAEALKAHFDIDVFKNMKKDDIDFTVLMFHRRHVYEHNGGEVDDKYIKDSGDSSVRAKQVIHEDQESASRVARLVLQMTQNIHKDFHTIFLPEDMPIHFHRAQSHCASV